MNNPHLDAGFQPPASSLSRWEPTVWTVAQDWQCVVERFLQSDAGLSLGAFIQARLAAGATVYPPDPFRALALTPLSAVRVVILGQDPYHGPGQAHGLAFSVADHVSPPPSLRNIFKEIARDGASGSLVDFALQRGVSGSLERWASQGVLLLNTCLTVEHGLPASHARQGWESLTDAIIRAVWANPNPAVFMLWGAHAQTKQALMTAKLTSHNLSHLVLTANHPSPLSALRPPKPFIGCGHFGQTNAFLHRHGGETINW